LRLSFRSFDIRDCALKLGAVEERVALLRQQRGEVGDQQF
jgi:hypothetical protein